MKKHYHLKVVNRFRFTVFVVATIITISTMVNFMLDLDTAASLSYNEYAQVEIQSGDTLWSIAEKYMPKSLDTREAVYKLCQINNIDANTLYVGSIIQVPIYH